MCFMYSFLFIYLSFCVCCQVAVRDMRVMGNEALTAMREGEAEKQVGRKEGLI